MLDIAVLCYNKMNKTVEFYTIGDFMINRNKYLEELKEARDNGFPKVITGIRRCGKSYLLQEIYKNYLLSENVREENIITLELDDDRNSVYRDPIELGKHIRSLCTSDDMHYVFLDEIQRVYTIANPNLTEGKHVLAKKDDKEVISFVDVVLGLSHEKNIDLYVTGSNSKMLSTDIITQFRDKAINLCLYPLSFEEFYDYRGGSATDAIYEYMQYGGMPLAVLKKEEEKRKYLSNLFEMTYFRDIIEHNDLNKSESLDELCNIISEMTGTFLNSQKIANTYERVKHEHISKQTIDRYIGYFMDAFLLRAAKRYDLKGRNEIGALRKYYFVDTGLRNARLNFAVADEGQLLENIVYNELIYNGYTVNVGCFDSIEKNKNGKSVRKENEIDFFARKGNRLYYIQVTADINNPATKEREFRPFGKISDNIEKVIVINKPVKETRDIENGFTIIGVADFLLRFIK